MKSVRCLVVGFLVSVLILSISPPAHSQQGFFQPYNPVNFSQPTENSYLNLMVGFRKYFSSFTSWQFPSADGGPQNPMSRLEYPWDQTFLAVRGTTAYTGLEVSMEWSGTLSVLSNPKAQDSDWQLNNNPGQKTDFSEAEATPRCWIVDLSCNMEIPGLHHLRGVAGYRTSQFKFTNTDGYIANIFNNDVGPISGPSIEFSQYYQHLYAGGIFDWFLNAGDVFDGLMLPALLIRAQADVSYVIGSSNDEHVSGYYKTALIRSNGFGWHVNLTTGFKTSRFGLTADADIRGIRTVGGLDGVIQGESGLSGVTRGGAKVWSDQSYVGINGTIFF